MVNDNKQYIDSRAQSLRSAGYFLEAFYFYSFIIEHELKVIIKEQEGWINKVVKRSGLKLEITKKLELKPLGELITIFAKTCQNKKLIGRLLDFNGFRKKIVHKLLDKPIEELNKEANNRTIAYYDLAIELLKYKLSILKKGLKSTKRQLKVINHKLSKIS